MSDVDNWFAETRHVNCPSCGAVRKASELRSVAVVELQPALLQPTDCLEALFSSLDRYGIQISRQMKIELQLIVATTKPR